MMYVPDALARVTTSGGTSSLRRARLGRLALAALLAGSAALTGCSDQRANAAPAPDAPRAAADPALPGVLATIGDEQVTLADLRGRVGDKLDQLETQYLSQRSRLVETTLTEMLRERVLTAEATKQGKTLEQLIAAEAGGTLEPGEVEIATWYRENPERVQGRPLDQVRTAIVDFLRAERRQTAIEKLESRLNADRKVSVKFEPYRVALRNEGAPNLGNARAAVTLVEFSDFQCPYCGRFAPTLKQVEAKYGDRVNVVYRQFPITSIHPYAFKAAEASLCAHEQGKFWALHDAMFADQEKLAVSDLKAAAARLGLDAKKFATCLDTGRFTEQVQEDVKEANRLGINGTPALLVNGVAIDGGAVPFEVVAKAIDRELARTTR